MTADSLTPEPAPSGPLYARESASTPVLGTQRGPGVTSGPQTGADGFEELRARLDAALTPWLYEDTVDRVMTVIGPELARLRAELAALKRPCPGCRICTAPCPR